MSKQQDVIDWSHQPELNELCTKYGEEWKKLDDFYLKNRIFAFIEGSGYVCKGALNVYPGIRGVFIFEWKDYPIQKKRFDKKLSALSKRIKAIQKKMGFHDRSLGN